MQRLISKWKPDFTNFLDIGCGDGILGNAILKMKPKATGVFLDFSESMMDAARKKLGAGSSVKFVNADMGKPNWARTLSDFNSFDIIVSGFAIHHQTDERKKELYREIHTLLTPGGVFLNLEHVASRSQAIEHVFDDYFIEALYSYHSGFDQNRTKEEIAGEYYKRPDKDANILAAVEAQCDWLREIGYEDVDCFFKVFELALFGGRKKG